MSMFAPVDQHGPDQRRKQLLAKLMQQSQNQTAQRSAVAMPGSHAGSATTLGEGRSFKGFGGRAFPKFGVTQSTNILPNILARLGVVGRPNANEVSPGQGLPITPPSYGHGGGGGVLPPQGSPIPAPPPAPPGLGTIPTGGLNSPTAQIPGLSPGVVASQPSGPPQTGGVDPGFTMGGPSSPANILPGAGGAPVGTGGLIPLANGHFYDPVNDAIVTAPSFR